MTGLGPVTPRPAHRVRDRFPILSDVTSERVGHPGETVFLRLDEGESFEIRSSGTAPPCLLSVVSRTDRWNRNWHQSIVSEGFTLTEGSVIWSLMPANCAMLTVTRLEPGPTGSTLANRDHWFLAPGAMRSLRAHSWQSTQAAMMQAWVDAGYPASSGADPLFLFSSPFIDSNGQRTPSRSTAVDQPQLVRFLALIDLACVIGISDVPDLYTSDPAGRDAILSFTTGVAAAPMQSIEERENE